MVRQIVKDRYDVEYTLNSIKNLTEELGYNFGKPYQKYSKRPKNAEESLKKKLELVDPKKDII
jgi:putative transposase